AGFEVTAILIVPDEIDAIANAIASAEERLIVTTGGTGIAARDVTPEATMSVCDRVIPGFGEVMRRTHPLAPLSRAQAAIRGTALVVNLPGSEKAAVENLQAVLHLIPHALELLSGKTEHERPARP
ncbi:MAG TPA: MogA/MoaB family molybdenum cofactor biosynthesis protein, partial [Thermoanaerobaculia bacterium]|nr:MogA/MoaB family molybdenum cofactor biosynthesis protein [Thermoanaerobaculia bacterium]